MKKLFRMLLIDQEGQGLFTYGLVILLFAIALISAVGLINGDFMDLYQRFSASTV